MVYTTKNTNETFNWGSYFNSLSGGHKEAASINAEQCLEQIRTLLSENAHLLALSLGDMLRKLLGNQTFPSPPQLLELGAGTGFMTRLLMTLYGGEAVLVDNCLSSFDAYNRVRGSHSPSINYVLADVLTLELDQRFDLVYSFGLIEHFKDKQQILAAHQAPLKDNGSIIVVVPMDSFLTRTYYEVHPEINLGYRELLTPKDALEQIRSCGLETIRSEVSQGYVYDFLAVLCR